MQLQQLTYFLAVADTRHFTRAAERVHVAQPSLSKQIRALEHELGAALFSRARGNIALTAAGEALLPLARRILADLDTARQEVAELAQLRRGRVRLGATPSLCTGLLPGVLRAYRDRYPGIQLLVTESGSRDLVRDLAGGELDLALIILPLQATDPALATTALLTEELVVASAPDQPPPTAPAAATGPHAAAPEGASGSAPAGASGGSHPAAAAAGTAGGRDRMRVTDLAGHPLAMFRRGYDLRELVIHACRRAGFEPTFAIDGGEMDAVLGFVAAGLGLAVVPSMVAGDRVRTTRFAAPGLSRTIGLAHRRDVQPPRAARALRTVLLDYLDRAAADGTLPPGTTPVRRRVPS